MDKFRITRDHLKITRNLLKIPRDLEGVSTDLVRISGGLPRVSRGYKGLQEITRDQYDQGITIRISKIFIDIRWRGGGDLTCLFL